MKLLTVIKFRKLKQSNSSLHVSESLQNLEECVQFKHVAVPLMPSGGLGPQHLTYPLTHVWPNGPVIYTSAISSTISNIQTGLRCFHRPHMFGKMIYLS